MGWYIIRAKKTPPTAHSRFQWFIYIIKDICKKSNDFLLATVKNRKFYILHFTFLMLLAFAVRIYRLDFQSIWWDEGHSIQMASAPIAEIPTLPGMDVHPPGFFAMLHGWMAISGRSEFALRYLSLVFSVLTVALLVRFGRRMGGWRVGLMAGWLAALSPFYVAYAQEVRMYAAVTFFALASIYFQWEVMFGRRASARRHVIFYALFTAAALYTHYFTLFLLAAENLLWFGWVIARRREKSRRWVWLGGQLGALVLFLPQLWIASRQIAGYANPNLQPPTLGYFIAHSWQAYTIGLAFDPARAVPFLWGMAIFIIAGVAVQSFKFKVSEKQSAISSQQSAVTTSRIARYFSFFTIHFSLFIIPLALYFIVLQIRPSYEPRYMMLVTPSLFLLMGLAFAPKNRASAAMGLAVAAIFVLGLHGYFTDETFFKDDSAGVTNWLAAETTADDIVLVDVPHPFHYYADRIPAPTEYLFVDVHTAADVLNAKARGKNRLYWVTWRESDTDPRGVIPFLLWKQAGAPQGENRFRGYRVQWWRLTDAPFSLPTDLPPADVNFDNVLRLDGLAFSESVPAGGFGWVTVHLSLQQPTPIDYKLSLRLRAADGRVLAQSDKYILNDRHFRTSAWVVDDPALNQTINVFLLPLADADAHGVATLEAVVYNGATGDSIAAYGVPTTNEDFVSAQIGTVQVTE